MPIKKLIFPVSNAVKRERLRNFLLNEMCDYMDADIEIKTIAVLEVAYSEDRKDVDMLLMAIHNSLNKKGNCTGI